MKVRLNYKIILLCSLLYIYIPIVIFLFGFTKIYCAILTTGCVVFALYRLYKSYSYEDDNDVERKNIDVSVPILILCVGIIVAYGYYMGYGGFAPQKVDWAKHNAVLSDLITHQWPVYYINDYELSMLTYYLAQYLVPAIAGKLFQSFAMAEATEYVWNVIGIFLVFVNLAFVLKADSKKKLLGTLGVMLLFSGVLLLAQGVAYCFYGEQVSCLGNPNWLMGSNFSLQYRSTVTSLMWAFPQWIVPCLIAIMFFIRKNQVKHYVTLILPMMLYASLSFLGFMPMVFGYAIFLLCKKRNMKYVKEIFSIENILMLLTLGSVLFLYFYGNVFQEKPVEIGLHFVNYGSNIGAYAVFCFCMFGIYSVCVWHAYKKDALFYLVNGTLLILPFFSMGLYNDFVMGGATIGMFFIMVYVLDYIMNRKGRENYAIARILLITCLCIGAIYPVHDMIEVAKLDVIGEKQSNVGLGTLQAFANRRLEVEVDLKYNYYSYDITNNLFYKYVARIKL